MTNIVNALFISTSNPAKAVVKIVTLSLP